MKLQKLFSTLLLCIIALTAAAQDHEFTVNAKKPIAEVKPTMYGIFFEDINFGADGGLYAELVENRSFEFPQALMGWNTFGRVSVGTANPAFDRNPHYVTLSDPGHREKRTGLENRGFFGIGLKKDMKYNFSVYARSEGTTKIRVELIGSDNEVMVRKGITVNGGSWKKYTAELTAPRTDAKGCMRVYFESGQPVSLDHISLFPGDAWQGLLRADLVEDLKDLRPGVFRFPGGCIVEGTDFATRYQWKHSVGPAENRPLNENRWNYTFPHRLFPNYYQTYGLGFYEFFLLSEYIGAQALPILNVGLTCQYQNSDDSGAHPSVDELDEYIQDCLDLIEFANGSIDTYWGKLRADMGHPEPFNLKQIGVGNEQWGPLYPERLEKFIAAIRAKYPKMLIVGSAGPSPDDKDGKQFTYGWEQMRRLKADLVDEHYYRNQQWFLSMAGRYDQYDRKGPKVFAGEYACHVDGKDSRGEGPTGMNTFEAALCEAAVMTGFERNADAVWMATYAPLFAHVEGWQWRPDLIWMDNLTSVRTPNYYVQQLFGHNAGTHVLSLTEAKKPVEGQDGLYATAALDKPSGQYIIKIVNTSDSPKSVNVTIKGIKALPAQGTLTTLHADRPNAINTIAQKQNVTPRTQSVSAEGNVLRAEIPAKTFAIYRF